jgi:hypothetical protein
LGLRKKFHFSAPTILIPSLVKAICDGNNPDVDFVFVPCSANLCTIDGVVQVINNVDFLDNNVIKECGDID